MSNLDTATIHGKKLSRKQKKLFRAVCKGLKMQYGGNINTTGYLDDTPTADNPYNIIPGGNITMQGVSIPVMATAVKNGRVVDRKLMEPGKDYKFNADYVHEMRGNIYSQGGYSSQDIYNYLFEDDEEDTPDVSTTPTEEDIQSEEQQLPEDTSDYDTAMQIALSDTSRYQYKGSAEDREVVNSGFSPLPTNSNAEFAFEYYKNKGLPEHAAAGIVGNLMHESGLNPYQKENSGGPGRGIAQWSENGRWKGLLNWAKNTNRNPYDLETQLDFVLEEPGEGPRVINALQSTRTPEEAAVKFSQTYERPGIPAYKNRIGYAKGLIK